MELSRMICRYNREGKGVFDQFYLDEDLNVPDAKEDVKQMIESSAEVKVEDLKQVENYVRASGKVYFRALYQTASVDSMPEILEGKIPFEEMIYIEPEEGEEYYIRNLRSELTVTVVNSRKLGLRAMVELELGREKTVEEEIPVDVESEIPVYKKCRKMNMLQLRTTKKDTYRIKEELTLPGTKESIGQLLMTDVTNRKLEIRPGQDELILRGELLVFCMYLSGEEKTDWVSQTLNYEGRILCDGVTEEMYYSVQHTLEDPLVDIRMDEDGEMRILGIEGTLSLRISIYEEEEPEILEDLYSLEKNCVLQTREMTCEELLLQNQSKCKVNERLALPELKEDVLQILHSRGAIQVEKQQNTENGVQVEGILHLSFLYLRADENEPYGSWQGMVPFSHLIECAGMEEDVRSTMNWYVEQLQVSLAGGEAVDIKAVLTFDAFLRKVKMQEIILSAEEQPVDWEAMEKRPGIVGHIVQEGEDLWGLAKQYMTTTESIMEVNHLENESVKTGEKLLIFKENLSIL